MDHDTTPNLKNTAVTAPSNQQLLFPHIQLDPILNSSIFYNSQEHLRLSLVHKYFGLEKDITGCKYIYRGGVQLLVPILKKRVTHELSQSEIEELVRLYTEWRDQAEYLPLRLTYEDGEQKWNFMKIAKRGNDVYVEKIKTAFKPFTDPSDKNFQQQIWFDPDIFGPKRTHMLYVTLEYDPSKYGLCEAYFKVGTHFNSFITNLRNKFKGCKIVFLRGWHSHLSGFPHIHVMIYFRDCNFSSSLYKGVWRLSRAKRVPGAKQTIKQEIEDCWEHGFVDIRSVSDSKKCFKDLIKYTLNDFGFGKEDRLTKGKSDLTNSLLWYFGKQSYGMSKDFFETIYGECEPVGRSIDEVDTNEINPTTSNSNSQLIAIDVLPVVPPEFLQITPDIIEIFGVDPPPHVLLDLENLIDECSCRVIHRDDGIVVTVYSRRYK